MVRLALTLFVGALCAALLGFGGIAGGMSGFSRGLFFVLLIAFIVVFVIKISQRPPTCSL